MSAEPKDVSPFRRAVGSAAKPRKKREPKEPVKQKKDLSDGFAMVWASTGGYLASRGEAAGRLMRVQGPQAGREFNRWVKGHDAIYRVVAPVLGADGLSFFSQVVAPPLLLMMVQHRPEMTPMLEPVLLPLLFDAYKEAKKAEAKMRDALESLTAELGEDGQAAQEEFSEFLSVLGFGEQMGFAEQASTGTGGEIRGEGTEPPVPVEEPPEIIDDAEETDMAAAMVGPPTEPAVHPVG